MSLDSREKESLRNTGIVGGGQVINILLGLVKTKVAAIILGPSGIGLIGLFTNAVDTVKTVAGMGLSFSGVRDIAYAKKQNDQNTLVETLSIFFKWSFYLSLFGLGLIFFVSKPLGLYIFNSDQYTFELRLLGIAVLFHILAGSFNAALQGLSEISKMVKAGIYSNFIQTVCCVLLYYVFKEKAIVPALIFSAFINFLFSYFFYKRLKIPLGISVNLKKSYPKVKSMLKIGFFTVIVAFFDQIVGLYLKSYIADKSGIAAVGIFTTVITVGGMYLSVVMSAVGTDYYPRLSAIHDNNVEINKALNVQVNILLILAVPLIITMLIFSDFIIGLLYSKEFLPASPILQWYFIGDIFKIISWPCGYIILAKGLGKVYIWTSISYTIITTVATLILFPVLGLKVVGISFAFTQFSLLIFYYFFVFKKFRIRLSQNNINQSIFFTITVVSIFFLIKGDIEIYKKIIVIVIYFSILIISFKRIGKIINFQDLIKKLWK